MANEEVNREPRIMKQPLPTILDQLEEGILEVRQLALAAQQAARESQQAAIVSTEAAKAARAVGEEAARVATEAAKAAAAKAEQVAKAAGKAAEEAARKAEQAKAVASDVLTRIDQAMERFELLHRRMAVGVGSLFSLITLLKNTYIEHGKGLIMWAGQLEESKKTVESNFDKEAL